MQRRRAAYRRLAERLELYREAKKLQGVGFDIRAIAKVLELRLDVVRAWLSEGIPPRYDRYAPDLAPSSDLAYLIGFWLGDGSNAGKEKKVRFKLADASQLDHVNRLLGRMLDRPPKRATEDGTFHVVDYDSAVLYDYLSQPLKSLMPCVEAFPSDFLRGFFDAEGYISCAVNTVRGRLGLPRVGAANTNLEYLHLARKLLSGMAIKSSIRITNKVGQPMTIRGKTWFRKHDVFHLVIRKRESVRRYFALVVFRNRKKREKLKDLVAIMGLTPDRRFDWFVEHYERTGRRWCKKDRQNLT